MAENTNPRRHIKVLNAEVARKIAAGEVIDRPNAIVRELMDNAVDSGADSITVEIYGGGIDRIRVIDNGCGIDEQDLKECARPHATSKIETETDLLHLTTLGFRGEALASIAAVSRLSITSGSKRLKASVTEDHIVENVQPVEGSIVQSEALFENFPARRIFLKRPASEMLLCKNTFIEKVLPKPEISFRLNVDGQMKLNLPAGKSLVSRFVQANSLLENEKLFYEIKGSGTDFTFSLVIGEPSVRRTDKKLILIYVNGRKITEYSLVQAIEYGCQGFFPNGTHPVAALFVQMNSEVVDFNIHPAKKEARFQDISALHHAVSSGVRNFFKQYTISAMKDEQFESSEDKNENLYLKDENFNKEDEPALSDEWMWKESFSPVASKSNISAGNSYKTESDLRSRFFSPSYASSRATKAHPFEKESLETQYKIASQSANQLAMDALAASDSASTEDKSAENEANQNFIDHDFKYFGTTLGVFLLAEKNNTLYLIDQHAAHERILYDKIMENQGKRQQLLIPYVIETDSANDDSYIESISASLEEIGFSIKNCGNGHWEITSVPERWKGTEKELQNAILTERLDSNEIISKLAAMTACKAAVKDGYILDSQTAEKLAKKALELKDPHCPHGRPVYTAITKAELFGLVRRTETL
ncbi:MAG: DNA mismatch repair endonuclease MutL [Treponema sp.]|nr:DNA mismatch repair endonuclease MutL [Treponema sp.]